MKYLSLKQLKALSPQRRDALWKSVKAKVGKYIDPWFDFMPETLSPEDARLNEYRKTLHRLVLKDRQEKNSEF